MLWLSSPPLWRPVVNRHAFGHALLAAVTLVGIIGMTPPARAQPEAPVQAPVQASLLAPLAAPVEPLPATRAEFTAALSGVSRGLPAEDDSETLRGYPLYPWLESERLLWQLDKQPEPPDAAITVLLARDADLPSSHALRTAWLKSLAARGMWPQFLGHYIEERADAALRCHQMSALIATGPTPGLRESALAVWRTGAELPAACVPVSEWLRTQDALTADEIAARARLALIAGKLPLANLLIRQLPEARRAPLARWADVLADPRRNLESAVLAGLDPQAALDGFARIARGDPAVAEAMLTRLEKSCVASCVMSTPGSIGELRREVGLNQSWSRLPEALDTFRRVPEVALDERGHEWRVRAALWAGEWAQAASWIGLMPSGLADQPRWRYWRARSAQKLNRLDAATADYERLTLENGYYAALAAERLDRSFAPHAQARPVDPVLRELMSGAPGFLRAREAYRIGQPAWARSEWNQASAGFDPPRLLEAARFASSFGWHLQAVASATRAEIFDDFELLYPRPYEAEVTRNARRMQLPAEWIYGVLRQESLYDPRARSSADALGLLQLLPATATLVARRGGLPAPMRADLFDPALNLQLGAAYLREQFDTFGGRFVLVLGAYNAGPNAVRRWLPPEPLDTDVWIENVPFNETRSYIQRIVWHSTVFAWRASGQAQRLSAWLTPISSDLTPVALPTGSP